MKLSEQKEELQNDQHSDQQKGDQLQLEKRNFAKLQLNRKYRGLTDSESIAYVRYAYDLRDEEFMTAHSSSIAESYENPSVYLRNIRTRYQVRPDQMCPVCGSVISAVQNVRWYKKRLLQTRLKCCLVCAREQEQSGTPIKKHFGYKQAVSDLGLKVADEIYSMLLARLDPNSGSVDGKMQAAITSFETQMLSTVRKVIDELRAAASVVMQEMEATDDMVVEPDEEIEELPVLGKGNSDE